MAVPHAPNGKLVVFLHAAGQPPDAILSDPLTVSLTAPLLEAGYVVAAADAGGNVWGNAQSVDEYVALIDEVSADLDTTDTYLLAISMGGLAAAQLPDHADINAWAAIYPVCDLASITHPDLDSQIQSVYPDGPPAWLSPASWPEIPTEVWASPADTLVPAESNGFACGKAVGATIHETTGEHVDPSNFDPDAVLALFDAH